MSQPAANPFETAAQPPRTAEVAAYLAGRMCHDFISPASAIVSGLDLLEDPSAQDMREDAMGLIAGSARKLADLLAFSRVAFGASAAAETFDPRELKKLADGVFAHQRADLAWEVELAEVTKPVARVLLNLAQIGGAALPAGGLARARAVQVGTSVSVALEAEGPRARLRQEVAAGIAGAAMGEGLHGHWVQAYYVHLIAGDVGGKVFAEAGEGRVAFAASIPL